MKNKVFPIVLFILVFSMSIGFIFLFNKNNGNDSEIIVKKVELLSTFSNGDKISINDFTNSFEKKYNFNINNSNKDTIGYYKIYFNVITPLSDTINNDFTYSLVSSTDSNDKNNVLVSSENVIPNVSTSFGSGVITPNTTHNYELILNYKGSLSDRIFVSQIEIEGEDK